MQRDSLDITAARRPEIGAANGQALEEPHHVAIPLAEGICYLKPLGAFDIPDYTSLRDDLTLRLQSATAPPRGSAST